MKPRTPVVLTILVSVFALGLSGAHAQTVLYVDDDAPPGGDGMSWSSAFKYLQDALAAVSADPTVSEIRVAGGVYKPDRDEAGNVTPGDREATFQLLNGVVIRGGYAGYGASEPDERDVAVFSTILSGDLNGDDGPDFANYDENSRHVVTGSGTDETAVLDGFTISGGNADNAHPASCPDDCGGGMLSLDGSPTLNNCTFGDSHAAYYGGGLYHFGGSSTLTHCTFRDNYAESHGGGAYISQTGKATMIDCTFSGNSAGQAGGLFLEALDASVTRCTFIGNRAGTDAAVEVVGGDVTFTNCLLSGNIAGPGCAGGIAFGLGARGSVSDCTFVDNEGSGLLISGSYPTVANCAFLRNSALAGGGVSVASTHAVAAPPTIVNCLFSGNEAEEIGGAAFFSPFGVAAFVNCTFAGNVAASGGGLALGPLNPGAFSYAALSNCVLWGNRSTDEDEEAQQIYVASPTGVVDIGYSDVQGWTGALGGVGNFGADPLFIDADGEDDIDGTEDDDLRLSWGSPCIDAGDNTAVPADVADLDGDGDTAEPTPLDLNWLPRFVDDPNTPDTGVNVPGIPEIVDMGAYEYQDCNDNGENDALDITEGTSNDCNENMVPDECEEDTDHDGVIDGCESCPDDPDKLEPGACGCGVADNDTDGDGTEDCNDGCPADPYKVEPGICGCGVPDQDADGDGTEDCIDACPDDPGKVTPGVCGCGVPDDDTDGDTVPDCIDQCPGQDDRIDEDQDGTPDCLEPGVIPAVSVWGAVVLGLLLLAGGKIGFGRRRIERRADPPGV